MKTGDDYVEISSWQGTLSLDSSLLETRSRIDVKHITM